MWYYYDPCRLLIDKDWAPIASEFVYLVYSVQKKDSIDSLSLFDFVQDNKDRFPHLAILKEQQFHWRLAVILRSLGEWKKQSKNSHYWTRWKPTETVHRATNEDIRFIVSLWKTGKSYRAISTRTGYSRTTVTRIVRKFVENGSILPHVKSPGRKSAGDRL
jgi:hypothetical protein